MCYRLIQSKLCRSNLPAGTSDRPDKCKSTHQHQDLSWPDKSTLKKKSLQCVHLMWGASRAVACPVSPSCRSEARDTQCVCVVAFHACGSSSCHPPNSHREQAQAKWTHSGQADPKPVGLTTSQFGGVYLKVNCAGLHRPRAWLNLKAPHLTWLSFGQALPNGGGTEQQSSLSKPMP